MAPYYRLAANTGIPSVECGNEAAERVTFIMLNPSTADHCKDDPTIRRCIGFAQRWEYGGLNVGNLFAWRSTHPGDLQTAADPVGEENDAVLSRLIFATSLTVVAWGNRGYLFRRDVAVMPLLRNSMALGFTKKGFPKHPLYVPYRALLTEFPKTTNNRTVESLEKLCEILIGSCR